MTKLSEVWAGGAGIRHFVSLGMILLGGGVAWGTLSKDVESAHLSNSRQDVEIKELAQTVKSLQQGQFSIKTDVAVTKTIVERIERKLDDAVR